MTCSRPRVCKRHTWLSESHLSSLGLSFLIYEMRIMICYGKYQVQNKFEVLGYYEKNDVELKKKSLDRPFSYSAYISRQTAFGANLEDQDRRLTLCWPCSVGQQLRTHNASKPGAFGRRQVPIRLAMDSTCHCRHLGSGVGCDADTEADLHATR